MSDGFIPRLRGGEESEESEESDVDPVTTLEQTLQRREEQIKTLRSRVDELEEELDQSQPAPVTQSDEMATEVPADGLIQLRESLTRAVQMEITPQNEEALERGLEATRAQLDVLIEELGLQPLKPDKGAHFDEERHRVVGTVQSQKPPGTILSVEKIGYRNGSDIVRRADVVVHGDATLLEEQ